MLASRERLPLYNVTLIINYISTINITQLIAEDVDSAKFACRTQLAGNVAPRQKSSKRLLQLEILLDRRGSLTLLLLFVLF